LPTTTTTPGYTKPVTLPRWSVITLMPSPVYPSIISQSACSSAIPIPDRRRAVLLLLDVWRLRSQVLYFYFHCTGRLVAVVVIDHKAITLHHIVIFAFRSILREYHRRSSFGVRQFYSFQNERPVSTHAFYCAHFGLSDVPTW